MMHLCLKYCVLLWSSCLSVKDGAEMRTVQRRAIRVIKDVEELPYKEQLNNQELAWKGDSWGKRDRNLQYHDTWRS